MFPTLLTVLLQLQNENSINPTLILPKGGINDAPKSAALQVNWNGLNNPPPLTLGKLCFCVQNFPDYPSQNH